MADAATVGNQFTDFYYQTFDQNRAQLGALYVCLFVIHLKLHLLRIVPSYSDLSRC